MKKLITYCFILFIISACNTEKKEVVNPIGKLGSMQIHFNNVVGNEELVLDTQVYINDFEEEFIVVKFNYFISNIALKKKDGSYVNMFQDSSYFLIKEKDEFSHTANLNWIDEGEYTGIKFIVGVDSLRSTMPKAMLTGNLDQGDYASDMYWTWNQGYIFLKLELNKYLPKGGQNIPYVYHIGGFGGYLEPTINNIKTIEMDFPNSLTISQTKKAKINIDVDLMKVISGPNPIKLETYPTVMLTPFSLKVSENYSHMFSIHNIE